MSCETFVSTGRGSYCNFNVGLPYGRAMKGLPLGEGISEGFYSTASDLALPPMQQRELLVHSDVAKGRRFVQQFVNAKNCSHLAYNCVKTKPGHPKHGK